MLPELPRMTLLQQRYVEARVLGPLIRAFQRELGTERANEIARKAIVGIALEEGRERAKKAGGNDLASLAKLSDSRHNVEVSITFQVLERSERRYAYNVTRCRFAEMYREMGLADLGYLLSCGRDFAHAEGFNPRLKLTRSHTIMEGAPYCDFRYSYEQDS